MVIGKFLYLWRKFVKLLIALMTRNQISTWPMWKSDFHMTHEEIVSHFIENFKFCCHLTSFFCKNCFKNVSASKICQMTAVKIENGLVNSYRNKISEWAVIFRYGNFFIPRVEKSSKISPWEKNLASRGPTALGRTTFFALGLILEDFSTLGMKKFPYLKTGPFGNPIFP